MILVVGGAWQGKLEYAGELLEKRLKGGHRVMNADVVCGSDVPSYAYGQHDSMDAAFTRPIVWGFHEYIRRIVEESSDAERCEAEVTAFTEKLIVENPDCIVITDEIGCGVVPMDRSDRLYRDMVGRACQKLAAESDQVHRVICGIGQRIK